jgi:hypothetical protein
VSALKNRMASFRPLLSDDIVVAFESLLWLNYSGQLWHYIDSFK